MNRLAALAGSTLATLAVLGACTVAADPPPDTGSSSPAPSTSSADPESVPRPAAEPTQPVPSVGECRAFGLDAALAPVSLVEPRPCRRTHTAHTFLVGRLDLVQDGHRLAVDSPAVQARPAERCDDRLARHLRTDPGTLRLGMVQAVWFTPSVEDAAAGADWFRCDVVVLGTPERLLPLPPRTAGMGTPDRFAMCATAEPGTPAFTRVACSRAHTWRAVSTVDLAGKDVPSPAEAATRMEAPCRDVARARASDPLDFEWSQESPTEEQWAAGQRYGICWVPA